MIKKIILALLVVFVLIQFFQPAKNISTGAQPFNVGTKYPVPANVQNILKKACYDCHSNNTKYPWYNHIQPVAWWLKNHIDEGKRKINFDEFTNRAAAYQFHKLEEVEEQIKEGEMPLGSYTIIHKDAILTDAEKSAVYEWVNASRAAMEAAYPKDSLVRPKKPQTKERE